MYGLYAGSVLIFLVSLSDEMGRIVSTRLRVSALLRLLLQIIAGFLAWKLSAVGIFSFPLPGLEDILLSPWVSALVTIGWFVLYMNAINRFDGVYGLATGVSTIGFWMIFCLLAFVVFPSYALVNGLQLETLQIALYLALL